MRAAVLALVLALAAGPAVAGLRYVETPEAAGVDVVVDSRPEAACGQATLAPSQRPALCLPPAAVLGPHGRLVGPRALLWRLGTLGLTGAEAVLVVGDDATDRDFVAGLLHLAGQAEVAVLTRPVTPLLAQGADSAAGTTAAMTRQSVFTAPMRDDRLVLRDELAAHLRRGGVLLLDGRGEEAFWGREPRAARGGHIPGAQSLPAPLLRQGRGAPLPPVLAPPPGRAAVAYAHDAREGIAFYTLLAAGFGVEARVYPGGWAEWATTPLPADAATYPAMTRRGS